MAQGGFCRVTCGVCKPGSAAAPASSGTAAAAAVASPAPQPPRAGARGDLVETAGQAPPAAEVRGARCRAVPAAAWMLLLCIC